MKTITVYHQIFSFWCAYKLKKQTLKKENVNHQLTSLVRPCSAIIQSSNPDRLIPRLTLFNDDAEKWRNPQGELTQSTDNIYHLVLTFNTRLTARISESYTLQFNPNQTIASTQETLNKAIRFSLSHPALHLMIDEHFKSGLARTATYGLPIMYTVKPVKQIFESTTHFTAKTLSSLIPYIHLPHL